MRIRFITYGTLSAHEPDLVLIPDMLFLHFAALAEEGEVLVVAERGPAGFTTHDEMCGWIGAYFRHPDLIPTGAGNIVHGDVLTWQKDNGETTTPLELRASIEQTLGMSPN